MTPETIHNIQCWFGLAACLMPVAVGLIGTGGYLMLTQGNTNLGNKKTGDPAGTRNPLTEVSTVSDPGKRE